MASILFRPQCVNWRKKNVSPVRIYIYKQTSISPEVKGFLNLTLTTTTTLYVIDILYTIGNRSARDSDYMFKKKKNHPVYFCAALCQIPLKTHSNG